MFTYREIGIDWLLKQMQCNLSSNAGKMPSFCPFFGDSIDTVCIRGGGGGGGYGVEGFTTEVA